MTAENFFEIFIFPFILGGALAVVWRDALRGRPSRDTSAARLLLFAHAAGAAPLLLFAVAITAIDLLAGDGEREWTLRRTLGAGGLWLLASAFVARKLVENARLGRPGLFGIFGRHVV